MFFARSSEKQHIHYYVLDQSGWLDDSALRSHKYIDFGE